MNARPRPPGTENRRTRVLVGAAAALLLVAGALTVVLTDVGPSSDEQLVGAGHGFGGRHDHYGNQDDPEGGDAGDGGAGGGDQGGGDHGGGAHGGHGDGAEAVGPFEEDFADIEQAPPREDGPEPGPEASTGSFTVDCGVNENGVFNSENVIVAPGVPHGAQHTHDYVGNQNVQNFTDDVLANNELLAQGETTCPDGDLSMHYWPVLRDITREGADADESGGGLDGNIGEILTASSATIEFLGNPRGPVTEMPEFLQIITGNARANTAEGANARAQWTCTGFEDRAFPDRYPLCPEGSDVVRIFDFPSCWDGENFESPDNRTHIVFPEEDGGCQDGFTAVPLLRQTLVYEVPDGPSFAVDGFPEEEHAPITDHSDHINVMPRELMAELVDCVNTGRDC
ncbi:DUF1996 domain-containing protein [Nocardiopsis sp. NRRL B-16309]|uniref:DUF1996 domain-containing protein n=1 Tax=Nocardiopsis sp. NRRL B-16309 TaxID=1519494 RepID=UPI0006C6DFD0|nr:DUF1996 domain-containing protein [Nocardiopsis sp. NRRL B-16309]KOX16934.1 hypothetical protein ADL05_09960 [Nocardiopsis sp. NRRL B-16309]